MPTIDCGNEECGDRGDEICGHEIDVELKKLERESNGSSGSHTTFYTYTGTVMCPVCGYENEVEYITDEDNETGEIYSCERA